MNRISRQLTTIAKNLIAQENEEQLISQLTQMSRVFTTNNVSQIIPVNFHEATTQGIENMLNKYRAFLGEKWTKIEEMSRYIKRLEQNLAQAEKHLNNNRKIADQIIDKCPRFKKVLSNDPKIRTKTTPKSQAFFRKKDLVQ